MLTAVLLSFLVAPVLQGVNASQADTVAEPPVRVWLNNDNRFEPGERARVHVRTSEDGYLVVLHADPDGRLRVLFPLDPGNDNFVRGGEELEVRGRGDRDAFAVSSTAGTGVVYAALSPDPFRFDPFVRGDHWDYRVLGDSGITRDPEAGLTDIVQRMTSDGKFDYDLVTYEVIRPVADAGEGASRDWDDSRRYDGWYGGSGLWSYRWRDPWYDSFHSSFYGSSFGLRLHFGTPWSRFHVFSGHRHPFYHDPFFYDPFYYDPFYGYYGPFYYHPFGYRYGSWYGRPWGFRRPTAYVYIDRPYDRYRSKGLRTPLDGGIRYRDRGSLTASRPGSRGSLDRGVTRSSEHGVIVLRGRRPVGSDDRLSRRQPPIRFSRPAPDARPRPSDHIEIPGRLERPGRSDGSERVRRLEGPERSERISRPDRPSRLETPSRERVRAVPQSEPRRSEPRRAEPTVRRGPMPSSIDRRGSNGGGSWGRPSNPRSGGYSRPASGYARPSGGYSRPSGGGYSRPSGGGYSRPSGGGYRRP